MPPISCLLLDRDGTLIYDKHYLADPAGVALLPGVGEALHSFAQQGMQFFLVSNQSGIGRGMFTKEAAEACNAQVATLLAPYGVVFTDMLFCPHVPEDTCTCRKPNTGMWEVLREKYGLDPASCCMVGDKVEDMLFAANANLAVRGLVRTGKGADTAHTLGLELPEKSGFLLTKAPATGQHPHLLLDDFGALPKGLAALERIRQ